MKIEKLEEIRQELSLNKTEFAELMGIKPHGYYHILAQDGKGSVTLKHLENLLIKKNVNPTYIITGNGDKFVGKYNNDGIENEPQKVDIEALYKYITKNIKDELSEIQQYKIKLACAQCFIDNPDCKKIQHLAIAAKVWLRIILRVPNFDIVTALDIGQITGL